MLFRFYKKAYTNHGSKLKFTSKFLLLIYGNSRLLFSNADDLKIVVAGVEIMNDDPKEVDVLYGKVHLNVPKYNTNFQKFVNAIFDKFAKKGTNLNQTNEYIKTVFSYFQGW